MLDYKIKVLAHIPTDIDLFDSTAQDVAELFSCGDCGLDFGPSTFLDTLLGLLKDSGLDGLRLQAAKPIIETLQDEMLLENIASRLRSLPELQAAIRRIITTARSTIPELQYKFQNSESDFTSLVRCLIPTDQESTTTLKHGVLRHDSSTKTNKEAAKQVEEEGVNRGSGSFASQEKNHRIEKQEMQNIATGDTSSIPEPNISNQYQQKKVALNVDDQASQTPLSQTCTKPRMKPQMGRPGARPTGTAQTRITSSATASSATDSLKANSSGRGILSNISSTTNLLRSPTGKVAAKTQSKEQDSVTDQLTKTTEQDQSHSATQANINTQGMGKSGSEASISGNRSNLRNATQTSNVGNAQVDHSEVGQMQQKDDQTVAMRQTKQSEASNDIDGKVSQVGAVTLQTQRMPSAAQTKNAIGGESTARKDDNTLEGNHEVTQKNISRYHVPSTPSQKRTRASPSTLAGLEEMIAQEARRGRSEEPLILGAPSHPPSGEHKILGLVKRESEQSPIQSTPAIARFSSGPSRAPPITPHRGWVPNSDQMCYFWYYDDKCTKRAEECKFRHELTDWVAARGGGAPHYTGQANRLSSDQVPLSTGTPIVDRLWGKETLDMTNRDHFVDTVIHNIQKRGQSQRDFVTKCVDRNGRSLNLGLTDNGMRTQLMSYFGTVDAKVLRSGLEKRLGVFVAANASRFPDLDPWMYEIHSYKGGLSDGSSSYGEPSAKHSVYGHYPW